MNIGSVISLQDEYLFRAVYVLSHKWICVAPIGMRTIRGKIRPKMVHFSCRNYAKILPKKWHKIWPNPDYQIVNPEFWPNIWPYLTLDRSKWPEIYTIRKLRYRATIFLKTPEPRNATNQVKLLAKFGIPELYRTKTAQIC